MTEHVWICLQTAELYIAGNPIDMLFDNEFYFAGVPKGYTLEWLGEL